MGSRVGLRNIGCWSILCHCTAKTVLDKNLRQHLYIFLTTIHGFGERIGAIAGIGVAQACADGLIDEDDVVVIDPGVIVLDDHNIELSFEL